MKFLKKNKKKKKLIFQFKINEIFLKKKKMKIKLIFQFKLLLISFENSNQYFKCWNNLKSANLKPTIDN